ncbi:MAG: pilus assembly protein PilV, partial [Sphaerotilus sp.]|nr:pilus assembly protein PilV [Sphaerotilus sp.]
MITHTPRIRPHGLALIEVLVSLLLLGLGSLSLLRLQGGLRLGADLSRQQAEAVRLAADDLEAL